MKRYLLILLLLPFFTFCKQNNEKKATNELEDVNSENSTVQTATYYLIRHDEKDMTDLKAEDPYLNVEGLQRAGRWADYFESYQIDKIYMTKYLRTKQTISMIAQQKAIIPTLYDPHNVPMDDFLKETNGKKVLIVGHSNTIPNVVNALIGKEEYEDMDDNDNSTLFKVTINGEYKKAETITVE